MNAKRLVTQSVEPKEPTSKQCKAVLFDLKQGWQITPLGTLERYGIMRLSQRIIELKALGYKIVHQRVKTTTGKHIMSYRLC